MASAHRHQAVCLTGKVNEEPSPQMAAVAYDVDQMWTRHTESAADSKTATL